jgi:hypothetical protein
LRKSAPAQPHACWLMALVAATPWSRAADDRHLPDPHRQTRVNSCARRILRTVHGAVLRDLTTSIAVPVSNAGDQRLRPRASSHVRLSEHHMSTTNIFLIQVFGETCARRGLGPAEQPGRQIGRPDRHRSRRRGRLDSAAPHSALGHEQVCGVGYDRAAGSRTCSALAPPRPAVATVTLPATSSAFGDGHVPPGQALAAPGAQPQYDNALLPAITGFATVVLRISDNWDGSGSASVTRLSTAPLGTGR